jgi:hypothetical protein
MDLEQHKFNYVPQLDHLVDRLRNGRSPASDYQSHAVPPDRARKGRRWEKELSWRSTKILSRRQSLNARIYDKEISRTPIQLGQPICDIQQATPLCQLRASRCIDALSLQTDCRLSRRGLPAAGQEFSRLAGSHRGQNRWRTSVRYSCGLIPLVFWQTSGLAKPKLVPEQNQSSRSSRSSEATCAVCSRASRTQFKSTKLR